MTKTRLWTCFALSVALLTAQAGSQPTPVQSFDSIEQGLEPTPLVAANFGLRIHLPAGSVVTSNLYNGELSYLITEGGPAPTWTMRVQSLTPSAAAQTAQMLVQQYLKSVRARIPNIRVIVNEPVNVVGAMGQRLYFERPSSDASQPAGVSGWVVLASSEYDFLVLSLATTATDFQRLRPIFEASIATIEIKRRRRWKSVAVVVNEPVNVVGAMGQRLYFERPSSDASQPAGVSGWVVLASSEYDFLVLSLATTATDFQRLRPIFEASIATIEIKRQDEVQAIRMARLARGRTVIDSFTPQKLRSLLGRIGRKTVYRIYTPAASGRRMDDTEIGYLTMECREGMRGELNAQRPRESYSDMESQIGLMVLVEARGLGSDKPDHVLDVHSLYWMAWDRSKEAWSTRRTERIGQKVIGTVAETGVRDLGLLNVVVSSKEKMSREPKQWSLPDRAYLCQPEVFFLGSLLPQDGSANEDMAFYYYESHRQRMPLRVDRFKPTADGSGTWSLISELATDAGVITQIFDVQGNRLRRIDANGIITERIDRQELQQLWKLKGLSSR